jgi:carbon-monoxide dehydrogenase small subunit
VTQSTTLTVNGARVSETIEPRTHLADFLRETLNLTATHIGCEHGVCGACTILVDGQPVRSCLTYAASCEGAEVVTIEGLEHDPLMAKLREAFSRHHGLQCGYCTPGMLATAYDLVTRVPDADEARVRLELAGNLCRCTGYAGIVAAIRDVLAQGPHIAAITPRWRECADAGKQDTVVPSGATIALQSAAASLPSSDNLDLTGGTKITRSVTIHADAALVWKILADPWQVAKCFPGAAVSQVSGNQVEGALTVSAGPIRTSFTGRAEVLYDAATRTGEIRGIGDDRGGRSRAKGMMVFAVSPANNGDCQLTVDITYKLTGPLAQFGRPAIISAITSGLLEEFARNVAVLSAGRDELKTSLVRQVWYTLMAFLQPRR